MSFVNITLWYLDASQLEGKLLLDLLVLYYRNLFKQRDIIILQVRMLKAADLTYTHSLSGTAKKCKNCDLLLTWFASYDPLVLTIGSLVLYYVFPSLPPYLLYTFDLWPFGMSWDLTGHIWHLVEKHCLSCTSAILCRYLTRLLSYDWLPLRHSSGA